LLNVNRYALGAFRYYNDNGTIIYEPGAKNGDSLPPPATFPPRSYPLFANNIGKTLSQPEMDLIRAYATWVGDVTMFVHHPLKETGLYTDLFIPRRWTLFEAKASTQRKVLRGALGQLFDYQRHYDRRPSLGVLLPERPLQTVMDLFEKKHITVVWRSRGNTFRDSKNGFFTTDLRDIARLKKSGHNLT
jgi:hypothetical protein